jgi:hypothetical protein
MMTLVLYGTPYLIVYHAAHGPRYGTALSGYLALQQCLASGQQGQRCTVATCPHVFVTPLV